MKKYLSLFLLTLLIGCSSQKELLKETKKTSAKTSMPESQRKHNALNHFINGATFEAEGDFANAILEFQDALRFDTAAGIYYALSKNYYFLNKIPLALQNSEEALNLDSTKSDYYYLLSDIFSSSGQFDSSAAVLEKLIGKDSSQVNAYYKLATIYENSKPLKAVKVYNKLTNIIGNDWNVLAHVAQLQEKLGNINKAAEAYQNMLSLDPGDQDLQNTILDFYYRNKLYQKAIKFADNVLQLTPDNLHAREVKARVYLSQGKWDLASKEFSYILNKKDVSLDSKIKIGAAYFEQSFKDSTLLPVAKEFFESINKDTTDWQVKMYLGAIAIDEHNDSLAIENFKQVTKLAKWNNQGWIRLGGLYYDNKKYGDAIKVLNEAIVSFPEDFTINFILGLSYSQENQTAEAKKYLGKAAELNPENPNALSAYGFILNQTKDDSDAINYLTQALELKPNDVNVLGTLGLIYDNQKKYNLCDSVYEAALKIDSTNALVNNNYAYSLSERGIKLNRALQMVQISLKADSANSSYLDTRAWIYFKLGDFEKAKEDEERALKIDAKNPTMVEHLGDIVFKIGQRDYAKELWQKALKMDSTNTELRKKVNKGTI